MFTLPNSMDVKASPIHALKSESAAGASALQTTLEQMQAHANALVDRIDTDTSSLRQLDEVIQVLPQVIAGGDLAEIADVQAMADEVLARVSHASPI